MENLEWEFAKKVVDDLRKAGLAILKMCPLNPFAQPANPLALTTRSGFATSARCSPQLQPFSSRKAALHFSPFHSRSVLSPPLPPSRPWQTDWRSSLFVWQFTLTVDEEVAIWITWAKRFLGSGNWVRALRAVLSSVMSTENPSLEQRKEAKQCLQPLWLTAFLGV